ncbi:ThiF family adenylyltransferase [Paucibacter sp. R3-3]|uniref:ThiF family adenylyltransferase n=1 Tax=Roseateles agri TaxID=3098619 RepID=A0ABU5DNC5_9BURK|nr:ThiF family adenylyltransferase [Paucibacter sp. R3-3]MDY0747228.1 ThiF family adenylyltransferase [Paucibacter sp. R3-3]
MDQTNAFDYGKAFSRNIGWVTEAEQEKLRNARVAIAGLGGVGGVHLLTLARLGMSKFNIADFDEFGLHNFNRQVGAFMSTIDRPKADVLAEMTKEINPLADIRMFRQGVTPDNLDEFLRDVDVYVDGIDFFALPARRMLFKACYEKGIPALTAAPLGMGVALMYFKPGGMSFEQYFRVEGRAEKEQYARFIAGVSPAMLQRDYLVAPQAVNFDERRGPSTMMSCNLCAGVMGVSVLKVLLNRGALRAAPWGMQFDAYHQKLKFTWRPFGNANPIQQLMLMLIRPLLEGRAKPR